MAGNIAAMPITQQEVKVIPCAKTPATNYMEIDATQVSECLDSGVGTLQGTNAAQDAFLSGVGKGIYEFLGKTESANNPASKPGSKTKTKTKAKAKAKTKTTATAKTTATTKTKTKAKPTTLSKFDYSPSFSDSKDGTGEWSISESVWNSYETIALSFKFGGGGEGDTWFVYELLPQVSSGDWSYTAKKGKGLSNMNIYGSKSVSVPEPGTLALLSLGIVGLLLARWRTRTNKRADRVS